MKKLYIVLFVSLIACVFSSVGLIDITNDHSNSNANFIKSHRIESKDLNLRGKISDLIISTSGYIIGEQNKSTLLYLDKTLKPIKRVGKRGESEKELKKIGPIDSCENCVILQDIGHSRILLIDKEGSFKNEFKSALLGSSCLNIDYLDDGQVIFSVADPKEPIVAVNLKNNAVTKYKREVPRKRSPIQSSIGNKGFVKNYEGHFFYFPPTETFVEIFDMDFNPIKTVEFGNLDFLKNSRRRAENIYRTSNNQTLKYYNDVYQDGNKFYLIAYTDQIPTPGNYKRALHHVIEFQFSESDFSLSRVIQLKEDKYYTQILVDNDRLLAFNLKDFLIDEYYIGD